MSAKEKIASLEHGLMEAGYTTSLETLPGYVKPLLTKGEIGIHLQKLVTIDNDADECVVMEMHMPFRSSKSGKLIYGYSLFFNTKQSGGKWWYVREFPYAEVPTCSAGRKDLSSYVLPISDEKAAIKIIEREVKLTRDMIEASDKDFQKRLDRSD